jgi:hypothetical protein
MPIGGDGFFAAVSSDGTVGGCSTFFFVRDCLRGGDFVRAVSFAFRASATDNFVGEATARLPVESPLPLEADFRFDALSGFSDLTPFAGFPFNNAAGEFCK